MSSCHYHFFNPDKAAELLGLEHAVEPYLVEGARHRFRVQVTSVATPPDPFNLRTGYGYQGFDRRFVYNLFFVYHPHWSSRSRA